MTQWRIEHNVALPQADGRVIALLDDMTEVGDITYHHKGDFLRLAHQVTVDPAWRRRGIGTALIQRLRADTANLPCDLMGVNAAGLSLMMHLERADPTIVHWILLDSDREAFEDRRPNRD